MTEDHQLLDRFTRESSREAMDQLIQRHLPLVYSSALRQLRDPHLAEDVTQAVFLVLVKKAHTIRRGVAVGGWLLSVARRACTDAIRRRATRERYERRAAVDSQQAGTSPQEDWVQIRDLLDVGMAQLSGADRDAVVLRFFEDLSFAEMGAELGLTEEAARKRASRALDKLRRIFQSEGVTLSAQAVGVAIANHVCGESVPATLAGSLGAGVSGASAAPVISIMKGTLHMMAMARIKLVGALGVAALAVIGTGAIVVVMAQQNAPDALAGASAPATVPSTRAATPASVFVPLSTAPVVTTLSGGSPIDLDAPAIVGHPPVEPPPLAGMDREQLRQLASDGKQLPLPILQWYDRAMDAERQWQQQFGIDLFIDVSDTRPPDGKLAVQITQYRGLLLAAARQEHWDKPDPAALQEGIHLAEGFERDRRALPHTSGPKTAFDPRTGAVSVLAYNVDKNGASSLNHSLVHSLAFDAGAMRGVGSLGPLPLIMYYRTADGAAGIFRITKLQPANEATYEIKRLGTYRDANTTPAANR